MIIGRLNEKKRQWHPLCNRNYANELDRTVTPTILKYVICETWQIQRQVVWCAFRWKVLENELRPDTISGKCICSFDIASLTWRTHLCASYEAHSLIGNSSPHTHITFPFPCGMDDGELHSLTKKNIEKKIVL